MRRRPVPRLKHLVVMILCVCLPLAGCHTLQDVPLPHGSTGDALPAVKRGDKVIAILTSGAKEEFRVTSVTTEALSGENIRLPYSEIRSLQVERLSAWKTTGTVAGVTLGVVAVLFALAIRALATNSD